MNIPQIKTKTGLPIGVNVYIKNPELTEYSTTYLSGDESVGQTTLSVISSAGFTTNDYVLIGSWGDETAEIRKISGTGTGTISTDATTFTHPRGTIVTYIPYNQIVISRSTDGGTVYGALAAIDIQPSKDWTISLRTTDDTTDYYKARFYNATTALYSSYSDAIIASGYADNSVFSIKQRALNAMGETINDIITDEYLNESLWEARRELENDPAIAKFPFRKKLNSNIGSIISGTYKVAIPTDLKDPYSDKNILGLRIGRDGYHIPHIGAGEFYANYRDIAQTTLNGVVTDADVTIVLTDSGDFDSEGEIYVASPSISGTIDTISYTGNTLATNTLTGVTGIATGGHADGTQVWQGVTFGEPTCYTIEDGYILFDCPFDDEYAGENIYMDYYYTLPVYNSDADILDEVEYDLFTDFLKWKIKYKKSNGTLQASTDVDYAMWREKKQGFITKQHLGESIYLIPN